MATCSSSSKCRITCTNGCGCVSDAKTGECLGCFCSGGEFKFGGFKPTLQTRVNLSVREIRLTELASVLDNLLPNQIAIPAAKINTQVSLDLKNMSLAKVLRSLGLVTLEK